MADYLATLTDTNMRTLVTHRLQRSQLSKGMPTTKDIFESAERSSVIRTIPFISRREHMPDAARSGIDNALIAGLDAIARRT